MGRSCAEHASYQQAAHCRFCSEQLVVGENTDKSNAVPAFATICTAETCMQRREHACTEMLACGHPCPGVRGEKTHAPCLLEECAQRDPKLTVCSTDLCSICWTEELGLAPVVRLTSCNHIFHAHCVVDKLSKRWPGVRITFGFMDCSICKVPMEHPYPPIQAVKLPLDHLWTQVRAKALARLTIEKMEKDQKLVDPKSHFYNKPEAYAMASFAYYNCFK
jgi:E3 ubiquitin-protein ligase MYCBP2